MPKSKNVPSTTMSVSAAIAAYLEIETTCSTAEHCAKKMLERVRELTGNSALTIQDLILAIKGWLEKGWIILTDQVVKVMRPGRAPIRAIAEQATEPPRDAATTTIPQPA
jgi:hypothetical protein